MKPWFVFGAVLFIAGCSKHDRPVDCGLKADGGGQPVSLSVLFIGTSHTHYNDLPFLISQLAASAGDSVYTEMSAPGGYDFERHFKLAATVSALESRKWDYIVLQESGWRTALYPEGAEKMVFPFADSLRNVIVKKNPSAKLILYMTNGYVGGVKAFNDTAWCKADPVVCDYNGMQDRIRENYLRLGKQLNAEIAPCGLMWKILRSKYNNIVLHDPDNIHPALIGSYVNAVTIYSVITKKRTKGAFHPPSIPNEIASTVQETVSAVLFDCNPGWKNF